MTNSEKKHLQEIFHQSQFSLTSHEKLTKQLKQFYEKVTCFDLPLYGFRVIPQILLLHIRLLLLQDIVFSVDCVGFNCCVFGCLPQLLSSY